LEPPRSEDEIEIPPQDLSCEQSAGSLVFCTEQLIPTTSPARPLRQWRGVIGEARNIRDLAFGPKTAGPLLSRTSPTVAGTKRRIQNTSSESTRRLRRRTTAVGSVWLKRCLDPKYLDGRATAAPVKGFPVKGFGCRPTATARQAPGPASESLQGRNPREVGSEGASGAMGIWPRRPGLRWWDQGLALLITAVGERVWIGCGTGSGTRQR
jgi:hypothetical protein